MRDYKDIGGTQSLAPAGIGMLALTARATQTLCISLASIINMCNMTVIAVSPSKANITNVCPCESFHHSHLRVNHIHVMLHSYDYITDKTSCVYTRHQTLPPRMKGLACQTNYVYVHNYLTEVC